jgi:hypothetical protein
MGKKLKGDAIEKMIPDAIEKMIPDAMEKIIPVISIFGFFCPLTEFLALRQLTHFKSVKGLLKKKKVLCFKVAKNWFIDGAGADLVINSVLEKKQKEFLAYKLKKQKQLLFKAEKLKKKILVGAKDKTAVRLAEIARKQVVL